jgi:outer membrane immunogenic protein
MRFAASLAALLIVAAPGTAGAADYGQPPLPPLPDAAPLPPQEFNWSGLYGGIHVNTTLADFNFTNPVSKLAREAYYAHNGQDLAVSIARIPTGGSDQQSGIGGYVGFNWLWEDVVVGLEADFTHMQNTLVDSQTFADGRRRVRGNVEDQVVYAAGTRAELQDYLIVKARGGYAWGRFLPYASIGLVVAQQRNRSAYLSNYQEWALDPDTGDRVTQRVNEDRNAFIDKTGYNYGAAFGVGLEYALLDNVIVRGEYQYIAMADYKSIRTTANTFRFGVGLKY